MAILSGFLNCSLLLKGKRGPAQTCHCRRACRYITFTYPSVFYCFDFPGDSVVKNLPADAGDVGSIPGSERSPRGGNGNPLQYSCQGNPMDSGAWWATVMGLQSQT